MGVVGVDPLTSYAVMALPGSSMRRVSSTGSPGLRHQSISIAVGKLSGELKAEIERQNHAQLIAKLAISKGLITQGLAEETLGDLEGCKQLVAAAIAQIEKDVSGKSYNDFIAILRSVPSLESLAAKLVEEVSRTNTRLRSEGVITVCRPHRASSVPQDDSGFQGDFWRVSGELPKKPSVGELVLATQQAGDTGATPVSVGNNKQPAQSEQPQQAGDTGATPVCVGNNKQPAQSEQPQQAGDTGATPVSVGNNKQPALSEQPQQAGDTGATPVSVGNDDPQTEDDGLKKKDAQILYLKGEIAEIKHHEASLQTQLETATLEKDEMEVRLKKTEKKLKETQRSRELEIKKLRQQVQDTEQQVEVYRSQVAQKERQKHEQLEAAEVKLTEIKKRLADKEAEFTYEIGHLSEQLSELREQLREKEEQLREKEAERNELLVKHRDSLSVITEQKAEIKKLRAQLELQTSDNPLPS